MPIAPCRLRLALIATGLFAAGWSAGAPPTPLSIEREPCTVSGVLRLAPPPTTRGVEPSPFRYRGTITLTPAPRVQAFRLELAAGDAECTCLSGVPKTLVGQPAAAFPWRPGVARRLEVECSSSRRLKGVPGVARIATSAEQASAKLSPATPLPACSGRFTLGD